jgi:hypothetical protein
MFPEFSLGEYFYLGFGTNANTRQRTTVMGAVAELQC